MEKLKNTRRQGIGRMRKGKKTKATLGKEELREVSRHLDPPVISSRAMMDGFGEREKKRRTKRRIAYRRTHLFHRKMIGSR